jgi:hypothetical protein
MCCNPLKYYGLTKACTLVQAVEINLGFFRHNPFGVSYEKKKNRIFPTSWNSCNVISTGELASKVQDSTRHRLMDP